MIPITTNAKEMTSKMMGQRHSLIMETEVEEEEKEEEGVEVDGEEEVVEDQSLESKQRREMKKLLEPLHLKTLSSIMKIQLQEEVEVAVEEVKVSNLNTEIEVVKEEVEEVDTETISTKEEIHTIIQQMRQLLKMGTKTSLISKRSQINNLVPKIDLQVL